jgi:hypothetical protein
MILGNNGFIMYAFVKSKNVIRKEYL